MLNFDHLSKMRGINMHNTTLLASQIDNLLNKLSISHKINNSLKIKTTKEVLEILIGPATDLS